MTASPSPASRIDRFKKRFRTRRAVEAAAWFLSRPLGAVTRRLFRNAAPREGRLLVVERILRIGDTLVTRPALAALRAKFPGAEVAVVCHPALAALGEADPLVDRVILASPGKAGFRRAAREAREFGAATAYVFVPDRWSPYLASLAGVPEIIGYDYAGRGGGVTTKVAPPPRANVPVFLYPEGAPPIHAAEIWLRLVDPEAPPPTAYPPLEPGPGPREEAGRIMEAARGGEGPVVVIHPGAANASYLWRLENWVTVGRELMGRGAGGIVVTGGPGEREVSSSLAARIGPGAVSAAGVPLLATCALLAEAEVVVTLDTAPVHLASTMGTPVVALYGPGDASMWAPRGVPYRAVEGEGPCLGCKAARCFQDRHYCMEAITPSAVIGAATALLEETSS